MSTNVFSNNVFKCWCIISVIIQNDYRYHNGPDFYIRSSLWINDLCRRVFLSGCLLGWRFRVHAGRWFCIRACWVWDTPRSRRPTPLPPYNSTCPHGSGPVTAPRTRPRPISGNTARSGYLRDVTCWVCFGSVFF